MYTFTKDDTQIYKLIVIPPKGSYHNWELWISFIIFVNMDGQNSSMAYYMANEIEKSNQAFLIYQDDNGITQVNVRFEGEDVWLPVELIMELFDASQQDVSYHIGQIYASGELSKDRTHKKFLLVRQEGNRSVNRQISHYNLDMIIAVGFRVQSQVATRFRQWATEHLHEFIVKGFTLDDNRLKGNRSRYFRELLQRIRDIRSSERNLYQQVTDIFITSIDYDPTANLTKQFFATVQNKMHRAVNGLSAAQIIYSRADAEKEHMGLTTWEQAPRGKIRKSDVVIAKNYLKDDELEMLERMVNAYLEFAESRAKLHIPMTMEDWEKRLDKFISIWDGPITVEQVENVTAAIAQSHAETEFEKYRIVQDRLFMSDYDRYLLALEEEIKKSQDK